MSRNRTIKTTGKVGKMLDFAISHIKKQASFLCAKLDVNVIGGGTLAKQFATYRSGIL